MEETQKYIDQIPDYLDGLLSQEEQVAFDSQLLFDEVLLEEVNLHRQIINSLGQTRQRDFRSKLEMLNREVPLADTRRDSLGKFFSLPPLAGIAAAILLLLLAGFWLLDRTPDPQTLLVSHIEKFDPDDILPPVYIAQRLPRDTQGSESDFPIIPDTSLHEARLSFSQKAYAEALAKMKQVIPNSVADKNAFLYEKGVLYLLTDQPAEAISTLDQIDAPALQNAKHWYLALSYLKLNQIPNCRTQLEVLISQANPWQKQAQLLMKAL